MFPTVLDNGAVLVTRIDDASATTASGQAARHGAALLVGVRDGTGSLFHRGDGVEQYFPVARGRVDWLEGGEVSAQLAGHGFGEALLVEPRTLPAAPGVARTFGDRTLFRNDRVCVYEEILGPGHVRPMHSHAPRLIIPLTGAHAAQRFPSGDSREDRFPSGGAHWAPQVMVHEIRNIGTAPFWAICVEHP
jgi:hypothetical protein